MAACNGVELPLLPVDVAIGNGRQILTLAMKNEAPELSGSGNSQSVIPIAHQALVL